MSEDKKEDKPESKANVIPNPSKDQDAQTQEKAAKKMEEMAKPKKATKVDKKPPLPKQSTAYSLKDFRVLIVEDY